MRVLITGATGFLGHHLAAALHQRGVEVFGTSLAGEPGPPGVALCDVDVRVPEAVAGVMAYFAPDAIVHLAALAHVGESWQRPHDYFQVNVLGTEHVLAAAGARRVVVMSSAEVYGVVPEGEQPIAEERPAAPRSPYALTKAAAERLALARGAIVARCFNLVGRGQTRNFALPGFAAQLAAVARRGAAPQLLVGNLSARRDYVHVDDAAAALCTLIERGVAGGIYNVASGEAPSIGEMLARLIAASGLTVSLVEDPARLRPIDVPLLCGRAERLRGLGWRPAFGVDEAVGELWREALGAPA